MRLHELSVGQSAVIQSIELSDPRFQRLLEMGLYEGCRVTLIRRAPLGDPLEFKVGDFHLSLRAADAKLVEVKP